MIYADWCRQHGVTHGHCPEGCEHPQPFWAGGRARWLARMLAAYAETGVLPMEAPEPPPEGRE